MDPAIKIRRLERKILVLEILLYREGMNWHKQDSMKKGVEEELQARDLKLSKTKKGIHQKSKNYIQTCPVCHRRVKTQTTGTLFSHGHNYLTSEDRKQCSGSFKPGVMEVA